MQLHCRRRVIAAASQPVLQHLPDLHHQRLPSRQQDHLCCGQDSEDVVARGAPLPPLVGHRGRRARMRSVASCIDVVKQRIVLPCFASHI